MLSKFNRLFEASDGDFRETVMKRSVLAFLLVVGLLADLITIWIGLPSILELLY